MVVVQYQANFTARVANFLLHIVYHFFRCITRFYIKYTHKFNKALVISLFGLDYLRAEKL